jgi:hypothetical protein
LDRIYMRDRMGKTAPVPQLVDLVIDAGCLGSIAWTLGHEDMAVKGERGAL